MAIFGKDESTGRSAARNETTLSIVASGSVVSGDFDTAGVLKVEGRIEGSVRRARQVMIAKDAAIQGDVNAAEVVVGGSVDGAIVASDRLELQSTAVVNGDITTKSIVVMEGARVNGALRMTEIALVGRAEERTPRDGRAVRSS